MNFHNHVTLYETAKRKIKAFSDCGYRSFYEQVMPRVRTDDLLGTIERSAMELKWYDQMRPYFKVWPAIASSLFKIKLDISYSDLQIPDMSVAIRFPEGCECYGIQSILAITLTRTLDLDEPIKRMPQHLQSTFRSYVKSGESIHTLAICVNVGTNRQAMTLLSFLGGETVEDSFRRSDRESNISDCDEIERIGNALRNAARAAITTAVLRRDPEFVKPDVLAVDRARYDATDDELLKERLVAKAKRRGVVGWRIGEEFESIPHIRRPHLGLRWTEKGRTVPKIVPIKGSVVHRSKMTQVPTGYITPDDVEVEV